MPVERAWVSIVAEVLPLPIAVAVKVEAAVPPASFWQVINQPAVAPLPFIGPQPSTTSQQTNYQNLTLVANGIFNFNLQNTQGPAGVGYDLTNVGSQLTLQGQRGPRQPDHRAPHRPGCQRQQRRGGQLRRHAAVPVHPGADRGRIVGYAPGEFTVNTAGFTNDTQGGTFSVVQQGNNLVLVFVPVPEPGTWALLCVVGVAGLGVAARRRQAARRSLC